jgi:hypothetical protein
MFNLWAAIFPTRWGAPWSCFRRSSGYRPSAGTLGCGLERPTWLVWSGLVSVQVSASSGAHRDVILSSVLLGHGGSSAGRLLVPPSFTTLEAPFLVRSGAEESTPAVTPLIGRPAIIRHMPRQPQRSWVAGRLSLLFRRGGGQFNHRALGVASLCLCFLLATYSLSSRQRLDE